MNTFEVRIVRLEPQTVAVGYGYGPGPELLAWEQVSTFLRERGLDRDGKPHRFFGFNNPNPSTGSPNYGYEQWVTVEPGTAPAPQVAVRQFSGGLYAVRSTTLKTITHDWHQLVLWCESNGHSPSDDQCLEECLISPSAPLEITEDTPFDLYLPIVA